jgi:hypothetical protein
MVLLLDSGNLLGTNGFCLSPSGQPSIEKCKKARLKREEAQELADLDVCNIITTQGDIFAHSLINCLLLDLS